MLSTQQKRPPLSICFLAYAVLVLAQWPASYCIQEISLTLGILLNEWLIVAGLPLWLVHHGKYPKAVLFPFRRPKGKELFWTVLMTFALLILIDYLTFLSEKIWMPSPEVKIFLKKIMTVENHYEGIWRWMLLGLTPAFCEELFFRGFFQGSLSYHWGKRLSWLATPWLATALAFALIHGIPAYWHLYFILGLFLSWLMSIGQNLWLPILAHLLNNSWTFLTHVLGVQIPAQGNWVPFDSLVMGICILIFMVSAKNLKRVTK